MNITTYIIQNQVDKDQYEQDLKEKQKNHIEGIKKNQHLLNSEKNIQIPNVIWRPCLHDTCSSCFGTGMKSDGSMCVHYISCTCPKCAPYYSSINY